LLQSELPGAPEIDGRADVFLQLNGNNSRPETGIVRLDIPDGQISMAHSDNSQHIIPLEGTFLEVKLEAATLTGVATVPALNENFKPVLVNVEMTGYEDLSALPLDLPIKGKLVAGGDDLSLLSLITPELESLLGSFDIDINIAGTLHEPQFQGKAEITNASYQFLDLGIAIDDINLVGTNMPDFGYEINGQLRSGDGIIQAEASVQQITREGIELTAELSGENFEMVNLPELWAIVNPTIQSRLSVGNQYYQGDIMIPAALIDLDEAVNTAAISDDEIVDGKKLNDQTEVVNQHISVNVSLGDEVEIRGMRITGKLSGQLFLSNINTNNILVADGEIAIIDGKFAAYGQELTISEGRLIYNKVSIENPTLSVKAIRNVDDITVGVSVSGYLSSPTVTLFSSSSLPQEEILSYIVFGRPLNSLTSGEGQDLIGAATALGISKSGLLTEKIASTFGLDQFSLSGSTAQDASIVVGKYINPRLYLSYGLGIVDRISTARLNYKLSNSFSLEAERGQEAGVDVFYNIEK
jgi:translocation and assembly module TamB